MSTINYALLMQAVATALATVAPTRVVTRTFKDFEQRDHTTELVPGIFTVQFSGIDSYPWDRCDQHDGEGPGATELPVFRFRVVGQIALDEEADGPAIEAAEFGMLSEIEQLADALVADDSLDEHDSLCRLVLKRVLTSEQLEAPFAWVSADFRADIE